MPITLPPAVAAFNQRVTNPLQGHWAWCLPPYALILHRGRRSGREFAAPVIAFRAGEEIVVPLLYGPDTQWVRNLLAAGGGEIVRAGRRYALTDPRVGEELPPGLRAGGSRAARLSSHVLVAHVGERRPATARELHALRPHSRRRGS